MDPSILVETAFISNKYDESNLGSVQYHERLAQAMFAGIRTYFYENPPQGTKVATLVKNGGPREVRHVIRSGETLSGIANQYHVPLAVIRDANHLPGDKIIVGRVLRIPRLRGI